MGVMGFKINFSKFQVHPNIIRQLLFILVLMFLGIVIIKELYFMIGAFFGAITLYVILMHPIKYLVAIKKWPVWLAAIGLMILSLVVMVIPFAYIASVALEKVAPIIENPLIINNAVNKIHTFLMQRYEINLLNTQNVQKISSYVIPLIQKSLGGTFSAAGNLFITYIVLYFMLVQNLEVEKWLSETVPLKTANVNKIITDIRNIVYSNALGIPIVAVTQGVIATIGYWIFGVEDFVLMGILTAIASVIPIVGTSIVYLPLTIYQFVSVGSFEGIGMLFWGLIVIGSTDNFTRFLVQKKIANTHPLITLFGAILGVNLFGFIGIIFGPLLLSIFFILFRIYINEFGMVDADKPNEIQKT